MKMSTINSELKVSSTALPRRRRGPRRAVRLVGCRHHHWRGRFFLHTKLALHSLLAEFLRCVFYNQGVYSHHAPSHPTHTSLSATSRLKRATLRLFTNLVSHGFSPCRSTPLYLDLVLLAVQHRYTPCFSFLCSWSLAFLL